MNFSTFSNLLRNSVKIPTAPHLSRPSPHQFQWPAHNENVFCRAIVVRSTSKWCACYVLAMIWPFLCTHFCFFFLLWATRSHANSIHRAIKTRQTPFLEDAILCQLCTLFDVFFLLQKNKLVKSSILYFGVSETTVSHAKCSRFVYLCYFEPTRNVPIQA